MSIVPELSIMYHHDNNSSSPFDQHRLYQIRQEKSQQQKGRLSYDQMIHDQKNKQQHQQQYQQHRQRQQQHQQQYSLSPPLSIASSSSTSSGSFCSNVSSSYPPALNFDMKKTFNVMSCFQQPSSQSTHKTTSAWNFTWLVFMNSKWVPFDMSNQSKLEHTLTVGGTFVDIHDSHFPDVKRVRVFPKSHYLSYLGVKYRLSRIMQPDAYLDHVGIAEAKKKPVTLPLLPAADKGGDYKHRAWEM